MVAERFPAARYAALAAERGIDAATLRLHEDVLADPINQAFLRTLEQEHEPIPASEAPPTLLIAPAAFYREYPRFGGDGRAVTRIARQLGLKSAILPSRSTGSVSENARKIADALAPLSERSCLLVSLSKGGADLRLALERNPALAKKAQLWLQIGGLVRGTPSVNELTRGAWWKRGLLRGYLALTAAAPELISEMTRGPGTLLAAPMQVPEGLPIVNVVGFPLARELRGRVRDRHARFASLGPNDGMGVLADAIIDPRPVVPIRGADHYFRTPAVVPVVAAILRWWLARGRPEQRRESENLSCLASTTI